MKNLFSTIRSRFLFITIGIAIFLIMLAVFNFQIISRMEYYKNLIVPIYVFINNLNNQQLAEKNFLLSEAESKTFFETGESNYHKQAEQLFLVNDKIIDDFIESLQAINLKNEKLFENLEATQKSLNDYRNTFSLVVDGYLERGNNDYGLIGSLQQQKNYLTEMAAAFGTPFLEDAIKNLITEGESYLLTKNAENINEIIRLVHLYKRQLSSGNWLLMETSPVFVYSGINSGITDLNNTEGNRQISIDDLILALEQYQLKINKIYDKDLIIGNKSEQGLLNNLSNIVERINEKTEIVAVTINEISTNASQQYKLKMIIWAVVFMILVTTALLLVANTIVKPIVEISNFINKLKKGFLPEIKTINGNNEIALMLKSLYQFVESLREKALFAKKIGEGELNVELNLLSQDDQLGQVLIEMQQRLQKAANNEKERKEQESLLAWETSGLTSFGDLMRLHNKDIQVLADQIIKELVEYLHANQGGLFLVNADTNESPYLELIAAYAYNQKKHLTRKIQFREGIIGACAAERKTVHLTEIPDEYLEIKSGFGRANPNALLIVPLHFNDELFGVVELASFNEFKNHEIKFVERIGESIASSLASVKVNVKTHELLEKSKMQALEMSEKESKIRQNMEELLATQRDLVKRNEDHQRTQKELAKEKALLDSLLNNLPDYIYFKDLKSRFIRASSIMTSLFKTKAVEDLIGKSDFDFHGKDHANKAFEEEQKIIKTGIPIVDQIVNEKWDDGRSKWMSTTKMPLRDADGKIIGTFGISKDITKIKLLEEQLKNQNRALSDSELKLKRDLRDISTQKKRIEDRISELERITEAFQLCLMVAELSNTGIILSLNENFLDFIQLPKNELIGNDYKTICNITYSQNIWEKLQNGEVVQHHRNATINSSEYKIIENYAPIRNNEGVIDKILLAAIDVTEIC